jgi:hypothetical protein
MLAPMAENSTIVRIGHRGGRESAPRVLLAADNTSVRLSSDGWLLIELFRYGKNGRPIESFRFDLCAEDRARIKRVA